VSCGIHTPEPDWKGVAAGVVELRAEVQELYRGGIDKPRVAHWLVAHELVARHVAPHVASRWAHDAPGLMAEEDPRAWVDAVLDDEFPLSVFYTSLQQKLDVNALRSAARRSLSPATAPEWFQAERAARIRRTARAGGR